MSLSSKPRVVALLAMIAGCMALVLLANPALANPPVFEEEVTYDVGGGEGEECVGDDALCPDDIVEADFDNDGDLDLATSNRRGAAENDVTVFLNDGDGTYDDGTNFLNGVSTFAIDVGDFNNDDLPDIVVADPDSDPDTVRVLLNTNTTPGTLSFAAPQTTESGGVFPVDLVAADFDGDGDDDVAVSNNDGNSTTSNVQILVSDGDGTFTAGESITGFTGAFGLDAGDFNGDGDPDLAVNSTQTDQVFVYTGTGADAATFNAAPSATVGVGDNPRQIAAGDFNEDDNLDFAATNGGSDNVSVVLGNGDGTFGEDATFPVGDNPRGITLDDFDGDGTLDIATQNLNSDNVSVLTNNGSGVFAAPVNFDIGNQNVLGGITSADLDDEGGIDIAVTNFADDTISVLINATPPVVPGTEDCTIIGTDGPDTLEGTGEADVICGLGGDDTINGNGGDDEIRGGEGDDEIRGNEGADTINGNQGNDTVIGNDGDDELRGGADDDNLRGEAGRDNLIGGPGNDGLSGGTEADTLRGSGGDDRFFGGTGGDFLAGEQGDDRLNGQDGPDRLFGGTGVDELFGAQGNDRLNVRDDAPGDLADGGINNDFCAIDAGDTRVNCEAP